MADVDNTAQRNEINIDNLPKQTSDWPQKQHEIYKLFKVRACVFDVETILWPVNIDGRNLNNWFDGPSKPYHDVYFDYLDKVFEKLDIDEMSWYEKAKNSTKKLAENAESMFCLILKDMRDYMRENRPTLAHDITGEIDKMNEKITDWLCLLRTLLEMNPEEICEASFEEVFRDLMHIVGLSCRRGDYLSKLKFQYEGKGGVIINSVSSAPDLLVYSRKGIVEGFAVAVVEVKKGTPLLKDDEAGTIEARPSYKPNYSLLKSDYPNGHPRQLTEDEEKQCSVFLPQLMGEVVATLNCPRMRLGSLPLDQVRLDHIALKSVIGFGVVGFKVYVVNFLCVRRDLIQKGPWSMHRIPVIDGMGTDILISEPLHLLKRSDRNKLFRLLCAMKMIDYKDLPEKAEYHIHYAKLV